MKNSWSRHWSSSKQPRKQRKYRANAPLHVRQRLLAAHLSKDLRNEYKRRSLSVRTGDEVTVKRGEFVGKSGRIVEVNLHDLKIFVDGVKRKMASGQEKNAALDPSNVVVTKLNMDDKKRLKSAKKAKAINSPAKRE